MKFSIGILSVLFSICAVNRVDGDIFSSISIMENVLSSEINAVDIINEFITSEIERHKVLKKMAAKYQSRTRQWLQTVDRRFLENPVAAYSILKHLANGWKEIEELMRSNSVDEILTRASSNTGDFRFFIPNTSDVEGAAVALMRLQDTYNLDTDLLASGNLPGVPLFGALSADDCFDIGEVAYSKSDDYHAILWLEEALKRVRMEQPSPSIEEATILAYLAAAYFEQQFIPRAIVLTQRWLELEPNNPDATTNLEAYEEKIRDIQNYGTDEERQFLERVADGRLPGQLKRNTSKHADARYEALCRGEDKPIGRLSCYYKKDKPFLRLAPIKIEVSHLKPDILLFRDVISREEVEKIKKLAAPKLSRSQVSDTEGNTIANYRISANTWLEDELDPVIARVSRRVGDMISLDMTDAETSQIANYGLGGHYEPHHDCGMHYMNVDEQEQAFGRRYNTTDENSNLEDRIATVMFYMVQPISGGATVFPNIGLTVFPTAGDAVFWYNVKRNGYEDPRVMHAACPVLTGSKWVLNKWISVKNQEFNRPCGLENAD